MACIFLTRGRRHGLLLWLGLLSLGLALSLSSSVNAIVVGNVAGAVPNTTVNPANYLGWGNGDPGWDNVSAAGSNYVYLGDGWVLSARHVGYNDVSGVTLPTRLPDGSPGPVQTFQRISSSYYFDYGFSHGATRYYAVSNPTTIQSETGQLVSLMDSQGTYFTDLQLFRINGDPGLPALTISSQPVAANFTRQTAPEVVVVGNGRNRAAAESGWNVVQHSQTNWTWTANPEPPLAVTHRGYAQESATAKRWGTNRLADPRPNFNGDPSDPGAPNYANSFEAVLSDTSGVIGLATNDGVTRDIIAMMTVYDSSGAPGQTPLEFQGLSGDSGSGVFFKRGDQWELAGIFHASKTHPNQPVTSTVYGNWTFISDLSYYNQDYFNSIKYIIEAHPNYSHIGDVNLDGIVSGTGQGAPQVDDVSAFIAGWGYDNGSGLGNITSWKSGDLNRDGRTNVEDFLLLRGALNGDISTAVMASLFGGAEIGGNSGGVPEPATVGMVGVAAFSLLLLRGRGRRGS